MSKVKALATARDHPFLVVSLTASQRDQLDYRGNELTRITEELNQVNDRLAHVPALEAVLNILSMSCEIYGDKITIIKCAQRRKQNRPDDRDPRLRNVRSCSKKFCLTRSRILDRLDAKDK